jgi:hypothetical protein
MKFIPLLFVFAISALTVNHVTAEDRYDFRQTDAYRELSEADREKLEQVHRDLIMLWGALDRYADNHDGKTPEKLEQLVPLFLLELPVDPFATASSAEKKHAETGVGSKDGWGYRYRRGAPSNRAWCLSSVGLEGFPYLAERGNVGLYICKGTWISGFNPVLVKD